MIHFSCQQCGQAMKAASEHGGKTARCPACQELVPIPILATAARPAAAPPPVEDVSEPSEAPAPRRRRPYHDDDDREADRSRKRRRRRGGEFADCPRCGCPGDATRVYWTWWGGLIGPAIIHTVRCQDCGTSYNGRTGQYNTTAIMIYVGVGLGFALAIICLGILAEFL